MNKIHSILIVDDDPVANFIHQDLLSTLNIFDEIKIALNGQEAIEIIKDCCISGNCPQIILLDLNMPVMDGFEFLAKFNLIKQKSNCKIRIIILSSSSNLKDFERARSLAIEDFMVKPLTEDKLKDILFII